MSASALWQAPVPKRLPSVLALLRALLTRDHNLLALLPASAYEVDIGPLGYSRRQIVVVNEPSLVKQVLQERAAQFPKSDLMVEALDPLVGQSIFTSSGEQWQQQRRMIDPAFTHMRVNRAFASMRAAVESMETTLDRVCVEAQAQSLDLTMSHLTADVICRTVFSAPLATDTAREVFEAFTVFERSVAQVRLHRLILAPAFTPVKQEAAVVAACERIRYHLGLLLDTHLQGAHFDDIASQVVQARDGVSGEGFSREALIDQLGVMFLAGHETTASALTWALTMLAMRPDIVASMREEIAQVVGSGPIEYEHIKALVRVRNVFREALRLYPPLTFMPRVALEAGQLGSMRLKRGALVMIAPWTIHRHRRYWREDRKSVV